MAYFRFSGTITKRGASNIDSIDVTLSVRQTKPEDQFKVTDLMVQEGRHLVESDVAPQEMLTDLKENKFYNAICRDSTICIIPYHGEIPYESAGATMPLESGYVTTPLKVQQKHYPNVAKRTVKVTQGISMVENPPTAKGYYNDVALSYTDTLTVDGDKSKSYLNGTEGYYHFGQFLRVPNANAKFKVHVPEVKTKTWMLLSYNGTKEGRVV